MLILQFLLTGQQRQSVLMNIAMSGRMQSGYWYFSESGWGIEDD